MEANADEGNCSFDMKWAVEGIQYSKEDSVHNFTTSKAIDGEKIVKVKRKTEEGSSAENLLIWNHEGSKRMQVLSTGVGFPSGILHAIKNGCAGRSDCGEKGYGNRKIHSGGADAV